MDSKEEIEKRKREKEAYEANQMLFNHVRSPVRITHNGRRTRKAY